MKYHNITKDDMLNGDGIRVILWVSGCEHHCPECQNPITWDPNVGIEFDDSAKQDIFNIWKNSSDKTAVEQIFYEFTGYKLGEYLKECQHTLNSVRMADVVKNWIEEKNCNKNDDLSCLMDSFEENLSKWTPETIENDKPQFFGVLIDATEDFLESIGIEAKDIPSEDKNQAIEDGEDPEGLAIIYGEDYDLLANSFAEILGLTR